MVDIASPPTDKLSLFNPYIRRSIEELRVGDHQVATGV